MHSIRKGHEELEAEGSEERGERGERGGKRERERGGRVPIRRTSRPPHQGPQLPLSGRRCPALVCHTALSTW